MRLENGMVVTLRDNSVFTVIFDYNYEGVSFNVLCDGEHVPYIFVEDYLDDLTISKDCVILGTEYDQLLHPKEEYDIMKIDQAGKTIWERS